MRRHLWMHVGLVVAVVGVLGLSALGVDIPIGVIYLVVLACPVMMIFMMFGMNHDHEAEAGQGQATGDRPSDAHTSHH